MSFWLWFELGVLRNCGIIAQAGLITVATKRPRAQCIVAVIIWVYIATLCILQVGMCSLRLAIVRSFLQLRRAERRSSVLGLASVINIITRPSHFWWWPITENLLWWGLHRCSLMAVLPSFRWAWAESHLDHLVMADWVDFIQFLSALRLSWVPS